MTSIRVFLYNSFLFSTSTNLSIISFSNLSFFAKYLNNSLNLLMTSSCVLSSKKISKILFLVIKNWKKNSSNLSSSKIISLILFKAEIFFSKKLLFKKIKIELK